MVEILLDKFSIIRHVVSMARVKLIIMICMMILYVVSGEGSKSFGCLIFIEKLSSVLKVSMIPIEGLSLVKSTLIIVKIVLAHYRKKKLKKLKMHCVIY